MKKLPVGIIGISGYTGLELVKILLNHSHFKITYLANTSGDTTLWDLHPALANVGENLAVEKIDISKIKDLALVFLALPHMESMKIIPKILPYGVKVVDLSADYRLNEENFNKTYSKHLDSKNLKNAVYGLVEWNREQIKNANLIANPGCYPTATLLGILPFMKYLGDRSVFVDAKSGVSGAGKKLSDNTHYPLINENIFSYLPLTHRHQIEISEKCIFFAKTKTTSKAQQNALQNLKINFIPHLSPFTRGMLVSIFMRLDTESSQINPIEILKNTYKNDEFIRIKENPVDVKSVAGTHFCDIFAKRSENDLYINTSIDNLLKGASSQAVANANLMFGLDEGISLPKVAYVP